MTIARLRARKILTSVITLAAVAGVSGEAFAVPKSEVNKTIALVGHSAPSSAVTVNSPGDSANCVYGINFNATSADGRIWYATLLEALSTGAPVDIYYDRSGGTCTLTMVHIR